MKIEAIDSVLLAGSDLDACGPYERLGLKLSPARDGRRSLLVGGPGDLFAVHFLAAASAGGPLALPSREAIASSRPLFAVALRVADLDAALGELEAKATQATRFRDGDADAAWLPLNEKAGTDVVLVRHSRTV